MSILNGKVALVTGSSRGIGAAIARLFAEKGARVAVHGRDRSALAQVRAEIDRAGGHAIDVVAEMTRYAEIESMRRDIEARLGPVDILVANAGGSFTPPGPLEDTTEQGWRASLEDNLTSTFLTLKSFLPGMKERRSGNIVTMSSAAARRPHARSPVPYAAAKAGLQLLTQDVGPGRPLRHPRELHRARDHPHRPERGAHPGGGSRAARERSPHPPSGHARGRGAPRSISCPRTPRGSPGSSSTSPAARSWPEA